MPPRLSKKRKVSTEDPHDLVALNLSHPNVVSGSIRRALNDEERSHDIWYHLPFDFERCRDCRDKKRGKGGNDDIIVVSEGEGDAGPSSSNGKEKLYKKPAPPKSKSPIIPCPCSLPSPIPSERIPPSKPNESLLEWYDGVKESRGMPWRKEMRLEPAEGENDGSVRRTKEEEEARGQRGYEVWVSEIMLQQTVVATVIPYYKKWMEKFPTVRDLAKADIETVNSLWKGLGYYSRASRLLSGAKKVVKDFKGILPGDPGVLERRVDGIGPYSAGAICSIAYGKRVPMVDGNIARVIARLTALHAPPAARTTTSFTWAIAEKLLPSARPGDWNQALMDLGAMVCTPRNPKCSKCPLKNWCVAAQEAACSTPATSAPDVDIEDIITPCTFCTPFNPVGADADVTRYPMKVEKKKQREEEVAVCIVRWRSTADTDDGNDSVLIVKRPEKGLLAGLDEFACVDMPPETISTSAQRKRAYRNLLAKLIPDLVFPPNPPNENGLRILAEKDVGFVDHVFSHIKMRYHVISLTITSQVLPKLSSPAKSKSTTAGRWIAIDDLDSANLSTAMQKGRALGIGGDLSSVGPANKSTLDTRRRGAQALATARSRKATKKRRRSVSSEEAEEDALTDMDYSD